MQTVFPAPNVAVARVARGRGFAYYVDGILLRTSRDIFTHASVMMNREGERRVHLHGRLQAAQKGSPASRRDGYSMRGVVEVRG